MPDVPHAHTCAPFEQRFVENEYFALLQDKDGVDYVKSSDEALIIPLNAQGEILFIWEPAPAFGEAVLLLPGGTVAADESPTLAANRELQEEIGFRAATLTYLGEIRPWSKYLAVRSFIFLAQDLVPGKLAGDEAYEIRVERRSLRGWERLIANGMLRDARVIAALHMAKRHLQKTKRHGNTIASAEQT